MSEAGKVKGCTAESSFKIVENFKDENKNEATVVVEERITGKEAKKKTGSFQIKLGKVAVVSRVICVSKTLAILPSTWLWPYYGLFIVIELLGYCSAKNLIRKLVFFHIAFLVLALCSRVYFFTTLYNNQHTSNTIQSVFIQTTLALLIFSLLLDLIQFFLSISIYSIVSRYPRIGIQTLGK